jgi:hypothetical protein
MSAAQHRVNELFQDLILSDDDLVHLPEHLLARFPEPGHPFGFHFWRLKCSYGFIHTCREGTRSLTMEAGPVFTERAMSHAKLEALVP